MAVQLKQTTGSGQDPEVMMEINTTPLIDVMLVLLVMLIITIPIQLHAVKLDMPIPSQSATQVEPEKVQIDIDEESRLYWQGRLVTQSELGQKMEELSQQGPQVELHIRPHKLSSYAVFANVLSSSKRVGLTKVAVIGSEQFTP